MILSELKNLALDEGLLEKPHFQPKPVKYLIVVNDQGRALAIHSTVQEKAAGEKGKPRPKSFQIPRQSGRTSGPQAEFFVDKAEYVFGIGERDPSELIDRRERFRKVVSETANQTRDPGALAVGRFLDRLASGEPCPPLPADLASNDLFAFVYEPDVDILVSSRPAVAEYWNGLRAVDSSAAGKATCLVCGKPCVPVEKHPSIKNVPGGTTSGIALVSFNSSAFESYGLTRNENAPVCQGCADAYTTGLNRLLNPAYPRPDGTGALPRRGYRLSSDSVAVYWSRAGDFADIFAEALEGSPEAVAALLGSPWKGRPVRLDQDAPFDLMVLSGAQGRAILRGWFEATLREVASNVGRYFSDLALVKRFPNEPDILPLKQVLRSLAPFEDDKNLSPNLPGEFFKAILFGSRYPFSIFDAALRRLRAERDSSRAGVPRVKFSRARISVLKAVLKRNEHLEVNEEMDESNAQVGYRLGRLFAVLERLQGEAIGKPTATIVDRYYGAASTTPVLVFSRLFGLAQHHASKTGGFGHNMQKKVEEIVGALNPDDAFPATLDLKQQGLFALGYYHQRADLWKKTGAGTSDPQRPENGENHE